MPAAVDSRQQIAEALAAFRKAPLRQAATDFLGTLGYASSRTLPTESVEDFCRQFDAAGLLEHPAALKKDWKSIDLLFQLTDEDIAAQSELFDAGKVQPGLLKSYLFFAVDLTGDHYARGKLTALARQINRLFPMPVMVLIKHLADKKEVLSIAVINRRQNQRDAAKDVLGKVTIIRDISLAEPHRGHLDILDSLVAGNLVHPEKRPINDFDSLHAAWEQIFNIELLNKRFYKELSNWYFWALPQVDFPDDLEKDAEKRRATGLIRLLTRLIFCWFLKEKDGLIPEKLFHPADLAKILKGFDPESETSSTYYLAILQNLFFATLNQRMGKDSKGNPYRAFATDEGFQKNRSTYDVNTLYRYEKLFAVPQEEAIALFADIPFLNGGLFECLDRTEEGTNRKIYLDGFSRNAKKRPHVPDRLFFDSGETADLSEVYGDKKRRAEKVTGIISILNRYKFTIVENTPIDQEIALDPELLGQVFENLLASYNEETKTTARKQTGSFYTPRPIVEYMVDESLKAHLSRILVEKAEMKDDDAKAGLDLLFTYTEKEHPFSKREVAALIAGIDEIKILDPACGSGAFPMGVLHKLVYIFGKLDPRNERLEQIRIDEAQKIKDADERRRAVAEIVSNFADNNDDYGRKLYLIENCLYGVDIQPIAIQITKLRFFISLVCDQKTNRSKKDNHGIRPLPNLETKFVAADTLIGLPEMTQSLLVDPRVGVIEKEIESLYHSHFSIQRRDQKLALQRKIRNLRQDLAKLLAESLMSPAKSKHVAEWDPFDPQSSADFFDPHWMFGASLAKGFDVVIGNPPYGVKIPKCHGEHMLNAYPAAKKVPDSYCFFMLRGLDLAKKGSGYVSYIVPNTFCDLEKGDEFRRHILKSAILHEIWQSGWAFESAVVDTVVFFASNAQPLAEAKLTITIGETRYERAVKGFLKDDLVKIDYRNPPGILNLVQKIETRSIRLGDITVVKAGVKMYETGKGIPPQSVHIVSQQPFSVVGSCPTGWKPLYRGGDIGRFSLKPPAEFVNYGPWLAAARSPDLFQSPKILMRRTDDKLRSCIEKESAICVNSCHVIKLNPGSNGKYSMQFLVGILNAKLTQYIFEIQNPQMIGKTFAEVKVIYVERLFIPQCSLVQRKPLEQLVERILAVKKGKPAADTSALEREIDQQVYALYGLRPEEIAIVEGNAQ